jgi:hypothetical protein
MTRFASLLCMLVLAAPAFAAMDQPVPHRFKPNQISQVVEVIEQEMAPGGHFAQVPPADQQTVRETLARMTHLLAGHASVAELSEDQKIALLNDQERINALLTGNDQDQLLCQRRPLPGTHLPQNVCETRWDEVRRREASRKEIRELTARSQVKLDEEAVDFHHHH